MKQDPKSQKLFKLPSPPSPIKTPIIYRIWLLCCITIIKPDETADVKNGITVGVWSLHWACSLSQCLLLQPRMGSAHCHQALWTETAHRHQAPWTDTGQPAETLAGSQRGQDGMTNTPGFPSGWSNYMIVYHEAKRTQRDHLEAEISPFHGRNLFWVPN